MRIFPNGVLLKLSVSFLLISVVWGTGIAFKILYKISGKFGVILGVVTWPLTIIWGPLLAPIYTIVAWKSWLSPIICYGGFVLFLISGTIAKIRYEKDRARYLKNG